MSKRKSPGRPVDEPLPDAWRSPKFQGRCWLCGAPLERPEILCDNCRDLGSEVTAPIEVYDSDGNHLGNVQVDP